MKKDGGWEAEKERHNKYEVHHSRAIRLSSSG